MLKPSLSNKQFINYSFIRSPCIIFFGQFKWENIRKIGHKGKIENLRKIGKLENIGDKGNEK